ncbi:hypothetical protein HDU67_009432 [Dinochytrium kinnereticum]|nr:hypothetical protein HDU67_009432 [Dinochytrium kinnereticum]
MHSTKVGLLATTAAGMRVRCASSSTASPAAKLLGIKHVPRRPAPAPAPPGAAPAKAGSKGTDSSATVQTTSATPAQTTPTAYPDRISEALANAGPPPPTMASRVKDSFGNQFVQPMLDIFAGISLLQTRVNKNITHYIAYMTNGEKVTSRTGMAFVRRTKRDFMTALPAGMYLCLPLKKWTMPLVMRQFPYFISTVYVTNDLLALKNTIIEKKRRNLSKRILDAVKKDLEKLKSEQLDSVSMARLMKLQAIHAHKCLKLSRGSTASHSDLLEYTTFFRDHYSILDMRYGTLFNCGYFMGMALPWIFPRTQIFRWASWCITDNDLIRSEGVNRLTDFEVNEALEEQGFMALSASPERQRPALMAHTKFTRALAENYMRVRGLDVSLESQITSEEICGIATAMILARALGAEKFD